MKITLLCSDPSHPVNEYISKWIKKNENAHEISLVRRVANLMGGDILFLVSCSEILSINDREKYGSCLLLHASDLPQGRGWSPYIWEIINGAEKITVTLLEVEDRVDSGDIWGTITISIPKSALWDEINEKLFTAEINLIDMAMNNFCKIKPRSQLIDISPHYYPRRKPEDSRIDPEISIAKQFDNIRVCDPNRYPAYFEMYGIEFKIIIEKIDNSN